LRGEPERVAARVRDLLAEHGNTGFDSDPAPRMRADTDPAQDLLLLHHDRGTLRLGGATWRRLIARLPVRLDPGRRTALAVGVAVLIAAIVTGAWVAAAKPRPMAVAADVPSLPATATPVGTAVVSGAAPDATSSSADRRSAGSSAGPADPPDLVVDVAGKVHRPGLYHLPVGARIDDAVRAAGGALHGVDLSSLNVAAKVVDGQQILVGLRATAAAPVPGGSTASAAPSAAGTVVDLNTATLEQFEALPGVGPVLAQHILDYRTQHGTFTSVGQLNDVNGIGPAKFTAIKDLVSL
jgi:competence protein ComEA